MIGSYYVNGLVRALRPDYYRRIRIGSEPESNPSNVLAKNRRLTRVGIASDPKLEAASVVVILQAITKR